MLTAVTAAPDCVTVAFHAWVTVCPAPNVHRIVQPLIGSPRLVTVTEAPKPPCHCELTVYDTWQPAAAAWAVIVVAVGVVPSPAASSIASTRRLFAMSMPSRRGPADGHTPCAGGYEILFGKISHIYDHL